MSRNGAVSDVSISSRFFRGISMESSKDWIILFLTTRYSIFNNACYKSKLLWSYTVKSKLCIQGTINIYKQCFTTHVSYRLFHNYFSIHFCIFVPFYIHLTLFVFLLRINCIHLSLLCFVPTHNMICISNTLELLECS